MSATMFPGGSTGSVPTITQALPTVTANTAAGSGDTTSLLLDHQIQIPLHGYSSLNLTSGTVTVHKNGGDTNISTAGVHDITGSDYMTITIYYQQAGHPTSFGASFPAYTLS